MQAGELNVACLLSMFRVLPHLTSLAVPGDLVKVLPSVEMIAYAAFLAQALFGAMLGRSLWFIHSRYGDR